MTIHSFKSRLILGTIIAALLAMICAWHFSSSRSQEPDLAQLSVGELENRLVKAAQTGKKDDIVALLAHGVDVDARPLLGITALWQACWSGHVEIAHILLKHGADPNHYDFAFELSPLMLASDLELITSLVATGATDAASQLRQACLDGDAAKVKAILVGRRFTDEELVFAKAHAQLANQTEVVRILDLAAQSPLPALPPFDIADAEALVGTYYDARLSELRVRQASGRLIIELGDGPPQVLIPVSLSEYQHGETTYSFAALANDSVEVSKSVESRATDLYRMPPDITNPRENTLIVNAEDEEASAHDTWPQFRGLMARGIARDQDLPREFSKLSQLNIAWNTSVPGFGTSSPIVWKERLFITTAIRRNGDDHLTVGDYNNAMSVPANGSEYLWKLICLDVKTGQKLWDRVASRGVPTAGRHPKSSYANATPATDGEHVVALFHSGDLVCHDVDGKLLWKTQLGELKTGATAEPSFEWGFASSPVLFENSVLLQCDVRGGSYVAAFDLRTGEESWRSDRREPPSWTTPLVYEGASGPELITCGANLTRAYAARTGREIWSLPGMSATTVPTPQYANGLLFVTSGQLPTQPILAIRASEPSPSNSERELAWSVSRGGSYVVTPLVYRGYLYVCSTNGVLTCYVASTGRQLYRQRIGRKGATSFSASPIAADGRIFFTSESGSILELPAGPDFDSPKVHDIGAPCMATPAIAGGKMFVRTRTGMVAVGSY